MYVLFYVITLLFIKTNSSFLMNLIHILHLKLKKYIFNLIKIKMI